MTNANPEYKKRGIITDEDVANMLKKADEIPFEYFRLRAKALVALAKKFGKRSSELAGLKRKDIFINNQSNELEVRFTLRKKHKLGKAQYFKWLETNNPVALDKPLSQVIVDWKAWRRTEAGVGIKGGESLKRIALNGKYSLLILTYLEYLSKTFPKTEYLFPSGKLFFGGKNYFLSKVDKPLSRAQLLNLIKILDRTAWIHLFRESLGASVAKKYGDKLEGVTAVKRALDLENESTAWHYVDRYVGQNLDMDSDIS